MTKINKLFQIEDFVKEENSIAVMIEGGKTIMISMADFNSFLTRHDRLDYCADTQVNGNHVQFAGTLSIEEYFGEMRDSDIKADLYDFIICKKIDVSKQFNGIFEMITGICKDYNKKILTQPSTF